MAMLGTNYSIEINRGDMLAMTIKANDSNGDPYIFKVDDVVRFKIMERNKCENVILQKDVKVTEEMESVPVIISSEEMKIGNIINKPVDYWYEVELNPNTSSAITILGYKKKTGPRILSLTPEGGDKS